MDDTGYQPSEAAIASVIDLTDGDPRKLAIAYLRAQRRAKDSEKAFRLLDQITSAKDMAADGNFKGAHELLDKLQQDFAAGKTTPGQRRA